jgi:hypothetical protein
MSPTSKDAVTQPDDGRATQAVLTKSDLAKIVETARTTYVVRELVVEEITPTQPRQLGAAGVKIGQRIRARQGARPAPPAAAGSTE